MSMLKLGSLRVRTKLMLAFGMLMGIITLVAVVVWANLAQVRYQAEMVTGSVQPAVLSAMELAREVDAANKSLGFFLLTSEDIHRDAYQRSLERIASLLQTLQQMPLSRQDARVGEYLSGVEAGVKDFAAMREQMLGLVENLQANQPAFAYAGADINPHTQNMLHLLSQMILAERNQDALAERRELLLLLGEMRYTLASVMSSLRGYLAFRGANDVDSIEMLMGNMARQMDELQAYSRLFTFEQEDAAEQLLEAHAQFVSNYPRVLVIHGGEQWRTDAWLLRTELGSHNRRISQELDGLLGHLRETTELRSADLMNQTNATRQVVLVMAVIALLVGLLAIWWLVEVIVKPIKLAAATMDDISRGGGDLTCKLHMDTKDELGQMCVAFNRFVGKIREIIGPVSQSTGQLAQAADNMSSITLQTRQGAERQQQETEQVATAMNEMLATAQDMVDSAGMAAEATRQADEEAQAGAEVVRLTVNQINALAKAVGQAGEVIQRLEHDSTAIGKVLVVIGDIADQTNLLALNAAIEAARAGEQGRGFAVVADEVRSLASRTQDSTSEIQTMINQLQSGAREAVKVMESGREQANSSVEQASHAGSSLQAIATAVGRIRDMNQHMADAARQQGDVAGEINRNLVTITQIADQAVESTASLEEASQQLAGMSHQLQSLVGHFKT
ncbi:MAG: methyl-accepting chemotaxis protein [Gammaproteobacteria bacterium]|nr:methyl-accepting chemotaxis protein [Gammaproteobacteria bacterium]